MSSGHEGGSWANADQKDDMRSRAAKVVSEPEEQEEETTGRSMDPELKTISAILRLLDKMSSESARCRVVSYVSDRFSHDPKRFIDDDRR